MSSLPHRVGNNFQLLELLPLLFSNRWKLRILLAVSLIAGGLSAMSQTWDGGGNNNDFGTRNNWNPNNTPTPGSASDLFFGGTTRLTPVNNYTAWDDWRNWTFNSGAGAFVITGNPVDFFGKIENLSANLQTVSITDFSFNNASAELNPVDGDLRLAGSGFVYNNGNTINVWGNNGKVLWLNMTLANGGGLRIRQNSVVAIEKSQDYTGNTELDAGQMWITTNGGISASSAIYVGNGGMTSSNVWFLLNDIDGGLNFARTININPGSGANRFVGGMNTSGQNEFSGNITAATGGDDRGYTLLASNGGTVVFSGVLSGDDTLRKQGPGSVVLTNVANSFSGVMQVQEGFLFASVTGALGSIQSSSIGVTVSSGASLALVGGLTYPNEVIELTGLGVTNGGALVNKGAATVTYPGRINITAGTAGGARIASEAGALTLSGIINLSNNTLYVRSPNTITLSSASVSNATKNTGDGAIYKDGTGLLILDPRSDMTGTVTIADGTLELGSTASLPAGNFLILSNGAALRSSSTTARTINKALRIDGNVTLNGDGANGGSMTYAGNVNLNNGSRALTVTNATISGVISNGAMTKAGAGILTLSGANTYAGGTLVSAGLLAGSASSIQGNITNNAVVNFNQTSDGTYNGVMSGSGALNKSGAGVLTLSANSTYSGATIVSNGTVIMTGTASNSAFNVASGTFLYGSGAVGGLTVSGQVSAGSASNTVGNLRASSVNLQNNGRMQVNFASGGNLNGTAGTDWDVITVGGGTGTYTVNAADGSDFVIALKGSPSFVNTQGYTNIIINAGTATAFATNKFTIDTSEFTPSLGNGSFTIDAGGGALRLIFNRSTIPDVSVSGNGASIANADTTPSAADHTDFGDVLVAGGTISRTFTVTNTGSGVLGLGNVTVSAVTGTATNFIVTSQPAASVVEGGSTTFTVQFNPSAPGVVTANLSFTNNTPAKTPYSFYVQGTGTYVEVAVSVSGNAIADGSSSPGTANGTDFGTIGTAGSTSNMTYTITNSGNRAMTIGTVTTSGTHAADFIVTSQPSATLNPSNTTSFTVQFNPSVNGLRSAALSFTTTDDSYADGLTENPFNFSIQGTGAGTGISNFPTSLSFSSVLGNTPAAQTFSVTNVGLGLMTYTLSTNASWISVSNGTGSVSAGAGQVHTAYVANVAGMAAGTSNATITITGTDGSTTNSPKTTSVSWTISAIPDPTAPSVTANGKQLTRLAWTKNASYDVMIVYDTAALSTEPSPGTAYSVGGTIGSGRVIYKGSGATLDHVVPAGTAAHYKFYSVNNNFYSAGVAANTNTGGFGGAEIVESFGYTNTVALGSLNGGNGWSGSWSVGSGSWAINSAMSAGSVYPASSAYAVKLTNPGDGQGAGASRGFTAVSTGSIYIATIIRYGFDGANKWAGIDLLNGASTVAYFGKDYAQSYRFGIEYGGSRNHDAGYDFNPGDGGNGASTNNQYLIIARYNFETDVFNGLVYYKTDAVPATEPTSWNATLNSAVISTIDGIKLSAGSAGGGQIGDVYYDEIRVARSWTELVQLTQPGATNYSIHGGVNVTDSQITSGVYSVVFDFYDTAGMSNSATIPQFDIWNATGTRILTNKSFTSITYSDSGRSQRASNTSHSGASGSAVVLGVYTSMWTAVNSNGVQVSNSDSLTNGSKTVFTVVDDDTTGPVHTGFTGLGRTLAGGTFTNGELASGLVITGLVTDADSGVYGGSSNRWTLFRNGATLNSGSFTASFADGSAISSNGLLTVTLASGDFTSSGNYTLRVFSANYDRDRSGDSESTTSDYSFAVLVPTITVSTNALAFSNLLETATSGNLSYTISGTNLSANVSVTSPPPFEISASSSSGFGHSLVITQSAGAVNGQSLYVRFRPDNGSGDVTNTASIAHATYGAITQTVSVSGTALERPDAQANATANPTAAYIGDTVTLRIDAYQTWRGLNRSYATVFGRYDNADLTSGTVEGAGVDPGFVADLVAANTPPLTNTGTFYWAMRVSYQSGNNFYYDSLRSSWADMAVSLPSSSSQSITVNPLTAPSPGTIAVDNDNRATRIDLSWTRWNSKNVLITRATATPSGSPVNGTSYSVGDSTIGNQTVIAANDAGTSLEATNLTPGVTYYFSIYSLNNNYYSTGATFTATATELPRARNLNGAATPSQPAVIYLGDSSQTFAFESWGTIEQNYGQAFLWLRAANADLPGGTRFSGAGFTNANPKTAASGTFASTGTWYWGMQMDYGAQYGTNFWYKNSTATWEQMSANGNGSTLSLTVSPINDPSIVSAVSNGQGRIDVSWTRNAQTNNVMVLRKTTAQSWTEPDQGVAYTNNQSIGSGVVVYNGSATSASATGLTAGTTFDFKLYSVNNNYYSPGVTTQATTIKAANTGVAGTLSSSNIYAGGSITVTASGGLSTGAYEFRQNGGSGSISFFGSGASRSISGSSLGTAVVEVRKLGDSTYLDSEWVLAGTVTVQAGYLNDWEATSNITTYATANLTVNGITWGFVNAMATDSAGTDIKNGTRSARINANGSVAMLDPKRGGISNLTFSVAKYSAQNPTMVAEYSTNGSTWVTIASYTLSSATFLTISTNILIPGDVYLRFAWSSGANRIFNLDDILVTDYAADISLLGTNLAVITNGSVTAATANGTDFGSVYHPGSGSITNSFGITNSGVAPLFISAVTTSSVMGAAGDFSVLSWPARVEAGSRSNLLIRFDPAGSGVRTAVVSVASSDHVETNYSFVVAGTGVEPEIAVSGNGVNIDNGDASPTTTDHTDFGSTNVSSGAISRTYTVTNSGNFALTNGSVTVAGTHAADFSVTAQLTNRLAAGGSATFTVAFDPTAFGTRSATISFGNNDADENPFSFSIQGTGLSSEIGVLGNGQSITNNDAVPSTGDHTDFGAVDFVFDTLTRTFTITNAGNLELTLGNITTSGTHAAEFTVLTQPAAAVASSSTTTFQVRFDPATNGLRTAVLSFTNNDPDENPYTFTVQGTGTSTPEIAVLGTNLAVIASGSTSTSPGNGTDFGSQSALSGFVERTLFVTNSGSAQLSITGVTTGGAHAADFIVTSFPVTVGPASRGDLVVRFDPVSSGGRTAVITVANNDLDESSYTFTLTGTGLSTASVETAASSAITPYTAQVGGNVTADGGTSITNRGVVYNTTGSPTLADTVINTNAAGTGSYSTTLSGLTPGETYYYRAFAQNEIGTSYGATSNFTAACFTSVVSSLTASATNFYDFTAAWSSLAGAASYRIDVSTSATFGVTTPREAQVAGFSFAGVSVDADTVDSAVTVTPMTVTSGTISAGQTAGAYFPLEPYILSSSGWGASSAAAAKAFEATIHPQGGNAITITSLYLQAYADRLGPSAMTIDMDGGSYTFETNMPDRSLVTFELVITNVTSRTTPFTIRMAGWLNGSRSADGTSFLAIDTLTLGGTVSTPASFVTAYSNRLVSGTSVSVTGLNHTTPYFFRVRAGGGADCFSSYSSTQTVTTLTPPTNPVMGSVSVSGIGLNSATLGGTILSEERASITSRGTVWGLSADPTGNELAEGGTTTGAFSHVRSGIPSGSLIYFRAWASNSVGKSYTTNGTFWTLSPAPAVGTGQNFTATSFDADWGGASGATNYYLDVSAASNFATFLPGYSNRTSAGALLMSVTGLTRATPYYYRVRSENPSGLGTNSATAAVTTLPTIPVLTTLSASNIAINTASAGGNISDGGGVSVASRGIAYATTQNPTIAHGAVYAGTGDGTFSATLTGLVANTRYYLRAFASNTAGIAYGNQTNFTTLCFTNTPTLLAATPIGGTRFTANWAALAGAADYLLDVSTNITFGGPGLVFGALASYDFPSAASLEPTELNAAVTASVVTIATGTILSNQTALAAFTNPPYISSSAGWGAGSQAAAKAYEFTLYPRTGEYFTVTSMYFRAYADRHGPTAFGFDIGNGTQTFTTNAPDSELVEVHVPITGMTNITNAITVKVQGWANGSRQSNGGGLMALDSVRINGITGIAIDCLPGYTGRTVYATSEVVTGLTFNSTYYVRVRGEAAGACSSGYSTTQTVVTAGPPSMNGFTVTGSTGAGSMTDGDMLTGNYTVTGLLTEAVAGIAVSNDLAPRYVIRNASSGLIANTNFFTTAFTNGTVTPVAVSASGISGTLTNISLGTMTALVYASSAGFGDPSNTSSVPFSVTDDDTTAPVIGSFAIGGNTNVYDLSLLGMSFTGAVTEASGYSAAYFYLSDETGTIIQSNPLYAVSSVAATGTMTPANMICGNAYTVTVVVIDGDADRPGDALGSTNVSVAVIYPEGGVGGEAYFPTASNVTVNGVVLQTPTTQIITDGDIRFGGWSAGIWLSHPDLLYTNADTPSISVRNNSGFNFINNMKLTNISYDAGGLTYQMTNNNLPGVSMDQVDLGTYTIYWSASNISECVASVVDRGVIANGTNAFTVIDDDEVGPALTGFAIPGGARTIDVAVASSGFAVTGLVQDLTSGVGFTSAPPYLLLLDVNGSVLASNRYLSGSEAAGLASAASMTGWISGVTLTCGNTYTVRVHAVDADRDRANDQTASSSNAFVFTARGPGGAAPTASNFAINGTNATSAVLTDAQLAAGGWRAALAITHGSLNIDTSSVPPVFRIRNSDGLSPFSPESLSWSNYAGTALSLTVTNSSLPPANTNLITTGTYSMVWSAETEGLCYGRATLSASVSPGTNTFMVIDDDPNAPSFSGLRAGPAVPPAGCADATRTNLVAGDIAILAMNMLTPADGFAFVATVDIPTGTRISFTDRGWRSGTASFRSGEGTITWQATNCVSAGSIVRWRAGATPVFNNGTLAASAGTFAFATGGDQILAFQGTDASPNFIYALNNSQTTGVWDVDATSTGSSALPPGLLNGFSAVAAVRYDHITVNTATVAITGTRVDVLNHIGNKNNWIGSVPTGYDLDNLGFTFPGLTAAAFSITDATLAAGGWVITGLVQDVTSGLIATGNDGLRYRVQNAAGTAVIFSNNFSVSFTNGTKSQQSFSATMGTATFSSVSSGITTVQVYAADSDADRASDSALNTTAIELDVRDDDGDPPQIGYFYINGKTTVENPLELSSSVISGQVRDVVSGIAFASAPPSYVVLNSAGSTVTTGSFVNMPGTDGLATDWVTVKTDPLNLVGIADCGTYTIRVTVADADYDHPADRLQTNLFFVINVAATGGVPPTASNFLVDDTESSLAVVTDAQVSSGAWMAALTVQHPEGLYTEQPYLPFFMIHNNADMMILQGDWDSINQVNDTLYLTNAVHASADYHDIDIGTYNMLWFARNLGACFAQTGFFAQVTGGTNVFTVTDDDATGPVPVTNITWSALTWTNNPAITLTWSSNSFSDASGIEHLRLLTNAAQSPGVETGLLLGSTNTIVFTNSSEGITTNWIFAVDSDNDRQNDRSAGATTSIVMRLDFTAPPSVSAVAAINDDLVATDIEDDTTQVSLRWLPASFTESVAAGAPGGQTLSPFRTYRIYYTENAQSNRWPTAEDDYLETVDGYEALGNFAATNILLTDLTPGTEYRFAIAGVDSAGNIGSLVNASDAVRTRMLTITNAVVNDQNHVVIQWPAAGNSQYDVIYADAEGYTNGVNSAWKLAGTVSTNYFVDSGAADRVAPNELPDRTMRFYRIAPVNAWIPSEGRDGVASSNIVAVQRFHLQAGHNITGIGVEPFSNTMVHVFGLNRLPSGSSSASASQNTTIYIYRSSVDFTTESSWYNLTSGTNGWMYTTNGSDFVPANSLAAPMDDALSIRVPEVSSLLVVGLPRIAPEAETMVKSIITGKMNSVTFPLSIPVKVKDIPGLRNQTQGYSNPVRADRIIILNNNVNPPVAKHIIYRKTSDNKLYFSTGASAENYEIGAGESIVIKSHPTTVAGGSRTNYTIDLTPSSAVLATIPTPSTRITNNIAARPSLTRLEATDNGSSVQLRGRVNPNSLATVYWFNYGVTTNYGLSTSPQGLASANQQAQIAELIAPPLTNGILYFELVATNQLGVARDAASLFVGCPSISITNSSLPAMTNGVPYSVQLNAAGGSQPYTYQLKSGTLHGLTLSPQGLISGTGTSSSLNISVRVTDVNGCEGSKNLTTGAGN